MTESQENKLKPCPFCGGPGKIFGPQDPSHWDALISCESCHYNLAQWMGQKWNDSWAHKRIAELDKCNNELAIELDNQVKAMSYDNYELEKRNEDLSEEYRKDNERHMYKVADLEKRNALLEKELQEQRGIEIKNWKQANMDRIELQVKLKNSEEALAAAVRQKYQCEDCSFRNSK